MNKSHFTTAMKVMAVMSGLMVGSHALAMDTNDLSLSLTANSFSSEFETVDDRTPMFGLEYSYSNKNYATEGMLYKVNVKGDTGFYDTADVIRVGGGVEFGRRFSQDHSSFLDFIVGVNYEYFDIENTDSGSQTYIEIPSLRAGIGAGAFIDEHSMVRMELGTDYAIGANYDDASDHDIDGNSIYAEMTYANDRYAIPYHATLFYKDYGLDGDNRAMESSEIGVKVGMYFF